MKGTCKLYLDDMQSSDRSSEHWKRNEQMSPDASVTLIL